MPRGVVDIAHSCSDVSHCCLAPAFSEVSVRVDRGVSKEVHKPLHSFFRYNHTGSPTTRVMPPYCCKKQGKLIPQNTLQPCPGLGVTSDEQSVEVEHHRGDRNGDVVGEVVLLKPLRNTGIQKLELVHIFVRYLR